MELCKIHLGTQVASPQVSPIQICGVSFPHNLGRLPYPLYHPMLRKSPHSPAGAWAWGWASPGALGQRVRPPSSAAFSLRTNASGQAAAHELMGCHCSGEATQGWGQRQQRQQRRTSDASAFNEGSDGIGRAAGVRQRSSGPFAWDLILQEIDICSLLGTKGMPKGQETNA